VARTEYDGAITVIIDRFQGKRLNPNIYRAAPLTGQAAVMADDVSGPNGLCFSPDEKHLYVVKSRADPNRKIRVFDVIDGRSLGASRVLIDASGGTPDGFRCDMDGNIWAGWGMGDPLRVRHLLYHIRRSPLPGRE
jgi:gluconolactonase